MYLADGPEACDPSFKMNLSFKVGDKSLRKLFQHELAQTWNTGEAEWQ